MLFVNIIILGLQRSVIVGPEPWGLGINETILPQYLKDVGYATHAVGKVGLVDSSLLNPMKTQLHLYIWIGLQRSVILGDAPWGLGINETILPQYLSELGYASHAVGKV